ncbi:MAG TPA: hypothetical protein VFO18_01560 [Methylomirabilota bacterium]|nr:hypothetical protein [Methylomirabilota bacterium]
MSEDKARRFPRRPMILAALTLLLAGCAAGFSAPDDLRIVARPEGLYLMTRSTAMARSVCIASGFDAARAEGRLFADGRAFSVNSGFTSATQGCQMDVRTFTVCQEGDAACLRGERE